MVNKESLTDMKYSELQKLAKSYGIKANAKANVLVAAIEAYLLTQGDKSTPAMDAKSPEAKAVEGEKVKVSRLTPISVAIETAASNTGKKTSEKKAGTLSSKKTPSATKQTTAANAGSRHQTPKNHVTSRRGRKSIGVLSKSSEGGARKKKNSSKKTSQDAPVSSNSAADVQQVLNTTFDIGETELPTEPTSGRKSRRSTYELKEASVNLPATTPATQATVAAAEAAVASGNKRKRSAPKSDENKPAPAGGNAKRAKMSHIPCRVAPAAKSTAAEDAHVTKPATKAKATIDWSKIHQKQFAKMEDIDDYLDRKTKRADVLRKTQPTPKPTSVVKAAAADKTGFMSPVLLTKDANFAFGNTQTQAANKGVFTFQAASVNTGTVTKPTANHRVSIAKKITTPANRTLVNTASRKSVMTPFATRNHNQSELNMTVGGSAKKRFDLQASLAKPITWKMHKGPLKPVGAAEHGHCCPHPHPTSAHCTDVKNVTIQSRDDRRQVARQSQAQRRHDNMAARRGMV